MRVHMSDWRKYLLLALLVPVLSSCSAARPEVSMDGVVLGWPDGKPIAGAIVVARWKGQESVPGEAFTVCYHIETTVTSSDGSFRIPSYIDFHPGVSGKFLSVRVYKAGYVESIDKQKDIYRGSLKDGRYYLGKDLSPRVERLNALHDFYRGTQCANAGGSAKNYYRLYEAIAHEAASLAVTQQEKDLANYYARSAEDAKKGTLP